jgi:hypothetical protein
LLDGKYLIKGFRNADIRIALHGDTQDILLRTTQFLITA